MAAVLHDVVEDTPWTLEQLRAEGFGDDVLRAVDALTKREGEDYFAFVDRAGRDPVARTVKIADIRDNMDVSRIASVTDRDRERLEKYRQALVRLGAP
jgi:(p)ppGpp synthase/HD superfamily hydrolase